LPNLERKRYLRSACPVKRKKWLAALKWPYFHAADPADRLFTSPTNSSVGSLRDQTAPAIRKYMSKTRIGLFGIGARKFMNDWSKAGPAHHCAIGVGHIGSKIEKLVALLKLETVRVC
jgi:hypothetical protein